MRVTTSLMDDRQVIIEIGRVRVFSRGWPHWKPFAFRAYGMVGFGAGPIGFNVLRRISDLPPTEPPV